MSKQFQEDSISFAYPDNWSLEREQAEHGWTVAVQSPVTAFLSVTFDGTMPATEEVAEAVLDALRADYPALEAKPAVETLAGQMAVGHDIHFFSLDLTNTCKTRCFHTESGTVLVLCQANDLELEEYDPVLRAICASLKVNEE